MAIETDSLVRAVQDWTSRSWTLVRVDVTDHQRVHDGPAGRIPSAALGEAAVTVCRHQGRDAAAHEVFLAAAKDLLADWTAGRTGGVPPGRAASSAERRLLLADLVVRGVDVDASIKGPRSTAARTRGCTRPAQPTSGANLVTSQPRS
ncbi:hypothetical protein WIS52_01300 [Pseudonocardia nematodicida]|uniref:Uncharacterized protein n=1 Tax=Pseudonocardia nematodicida TaxID=1206997 RepID=A0ABV1K3R5_9PSEU